MTSDELMGQLSGSAAHRMEVLRHVREFRGLDASGFATLAAHAVPERHERGTVLWEKGALATDFLVVVEGNVMPRLATVSPVQANQTVGLLPLFAVEGDTLPVRSGGVMVASEEAVVLRIQYETFQVWIAMVALDVARLFARHLVQTDEDLSYV